MRAIILLLLFLVECLWGRDKGVTAEVKKTKGYFILADEAKVEKWQWWSFVEKNSYLDFTVCNSNGTFLVINSEEKEGERSWGDGYRHITQQLVKSWKKELTNSNSSWVWVLWPLSVDFYSKKKFSGEFVFLTMPLHQERPQTISHWRRDREIRIGEQWQTLMGGQQLISINRKVSYNSRRFNSYSLIKFNDQDINKETKWRQMTGSGGGHGKSYLMVMEERMKNIYLEYNL